MADEATLEEINERSPSEQASYWLGEVDRGERYFRAWQKVSRQIIKRYRNERASGVDSLGRELSARRFNIFWSNVQTTRPVIYGRVPAPEVERRHHDSDPVGRLAAEILQRTLSYALEEYDFDGVMKNVVEDLQLCGRGQAWIKYDAKFETKREELPVQQAMFEEFDELGSIQRPGFVGQDGLEVSPELIQDGENGPFLEGDEFEEKEYEEVMCDYVSWDDFMHSPARTWAEVVNNGWVARRVYMTRDELKDRFGDEGKKVQLTARRAGEVIDADEASSENLGVVWEIWNKPDKKVRWVSPGYKDGILDEEDDPLNLGQFFPCPKPLFATTTNDTMVPVPDFLQYEDQAKELDAITVRIDVLTSALRVAGIYDASGEESLEQLFDGSNKNLLIPVTNWAAMAAKGGLDGVLSFVPLSDVVGALQSLYVAREQVKQTLYEVTGIADIIRGQSAPSETLGAQKIKGRFATLRLDEKQREVARFARDIIRLKAEVISEQFEPETLAIMSGVAQMPEAQGPQFMQMFGQAVELLRDDQLRGFRVDIETDSTVVVDEEEEKRSRVEFLQAAGGFLQQAVEVGTQAPQLLPVLGEMLLFGIRGFRAGRQLEGTFENAIKQLSEPKEEGPDPRMQAMEQEMQMKAQGQQAELQLKAQGLQGDMQLKAQGLQGDQALAAEKVRGELEIQALKAANG